MLSSTGRLSDNGMSQAFAFAKSFKDAHHITHIFCSPEIRCKQTAEVALREVIARGIPFMVVQELSDNRGIGISFIWRYLDPRERNEVVMISHGSVLPTLLRQHHAG
ncbi:predicted protein [Sclerotinia sclerotiorum 1980 UF-70]|uniref:Histidine phosphatase family protein n=2 Tax=Sclerotinia sclerotiorum (strain ATCC 18683 / 1980 / Ss-1) TaxID=665079 RepID=A7EPK3_SCLS1|nr:predicted protein [Sclerotinia sclerotiorum 1980 UF-70]APA10295.1 hypothetical protein sscle_06g050650 [Sclerotinia sclerotiorum 1980 UF-70]EDO04769.1 predicted protein [Sclerotinia sclerotiorum 1980 UF-70]